MIEQGFREMSGEGGFEGVTRQGLSPARDAVPLHALRAT